MNNYNNTMRRLGRQTFDFPGCPVITSTGSVVGEKEGKGPLANYFDLILEEDMFGEKTWEKAESKMLKEAMLLAAKKSGKKPEDIDVMLCGDLLNQLMSCSFTARDLQIPFLGLYGACSAMCESLLIASTLIDGGYANSALAAASSHYCTAERQFRMPLEHGNQRPPAAQWTVTAAGAAIVQKNEAKEKTGPQVCIRRATMGRVMDAGITDTHQMGAAMAPAAVDTLCTHFQDTGTKPDDYDAILTGDMGFIGKQIVIDLMRKKGYDITPVYDDCGVLMYFKEKQDVHSGGSGCGCSASVFCGKIFRDMMNGKLKKVILISTGALMTTQSSQQGESIPGIAHAVSMEVM
mgnify:FL=1